MSRSTLRWAVIIMTAFTALVHLYLGATSISNPQMLNLAVLWLLNGVGYFTILGGVMGVTPVLKDRKAVSHYLLMGFALVTIFAWVFMSGVLNGEPPGALAIVTKLDELLLMAATYMHLRA